MYKICHKNLRNICSPDEMKAIMQSTLWKCVQQFDETKNAKFSSYLYRSLDNNTRRIYKKSQKVKGREVRYIPNVHQKVYNTEAITEAKDILLSVKDKNEEYYNILVQKYYYNYTNEEIGKLNGYGKECARKKIKKALDLCRKMCIDK